MRCSDPAVDRARHDQGRVGHAIGDDAIDLGVGLAEDAHRVARRAQIAFGGLLVGNRLFQIFLRYGERLVELAKARQIARGQLQHASGGDQVQLGCQQIGAVDREQRLPLLDVVPDWRRTGR